MAWYIQITQYYKVAITYESVGGTGKSTRWSDMSWKFRLKIHGFLFDSVAVLRLQLKKTKKLLTTAVFSVDDGNVMDFGCLTEINGQPRTSFIVCVCMELLSYQSVSVLPSTARLDAPRSASNLCHVCFPSARFDKSEKNRLIIINVQL